MTALPSTEDLARLAKAITPGPWKAGLHPWPTQVGCCPLPGRPYEISHEMRNLAAANTIANASAIALVPALIREVLAHRKAEAGMRALLRAGCDLLAIESEALRNSIRIVGEPDRLSDAPEDAHTVEAIREIEDWIASVKATLYPTTPEGAIHDR